MVGSIVSASAPIRRTCSALVLGLLLSPASSQALEERVEDLTASVEVSSVFRFTLDKPNLTFHDVSPGKTKILGEGRWFNEIRCRSNSGQPWYLNAQVASLRNSQGGDELPPASLQYKVVDVQGSGTPAGGSEFRPFAEQPTLVYASRGADDQGREVILRLQYSLSTPANALAGNYLGQVVFTMVENP